MALTVPHIQGTESLINLSSVHDTCGTEGKPGQPSEGGHTNPEVHTTLTAQNVGPDADREARHTNLGSAQRVDLEAEGRMHKPHDKKGRLVRKNKSTQTLGHRV